jgi:hypothetical protein
MSTPCDRKRARNASVPEMSSDNTSAPTRLALRLMVLELRMRPMAPTHSRSSRFMTMLS